MKKFLFLLILTIACISCNVRDYSNVKEENAEFGWNYINNGSGRSFTKYRKINIDDHQYIIFEYKEGYSGGLLVIHSESCPCKNKKR